MAFQQLDLLCPLPMQLPHDAHDADGCWVMVLWNRWGIGPNSGKSTKNGKNAAFVAVGCFGLPKNWKHFVAEVPN